MNQVDRYCLRGVPTKFDFTMEVVDLPNDVWKILIDYFKRLSDYEDSGLSPDEVKALVSAVDAEPVRHGRWVQSKEHRPWFTCSICEDCYVDGEWVDGHKWSYCPNCGAKMDEGAGNG